MKKKPHGREEVTEAILKAAAQLFSRYGTDAVSLRQIATRAKVNHGLIHRHFGSKKELRRRAQEYLAARALEEIGTPQSAMEGTWKAIDAVRRNEEFWRVLARTFLDGKFEGDVMTEFPYVRNQVELVRRDQQRGILPRDMDPRILVAGSMAIVLGLLVFQPYIVAGTGLDKEYGSGAFDRIVRAWAEFFLK